jgi:hypothetical protein
LPKQSDIFLFIESTANGKAKVSVGSYPGVNIDGTNYRKGESFWIDLKKQVGDTWWDY